MNTARLWIGRPRNKNEGQTRISEPETRVRLEFSQRAKCNPQNAGPENSSLTLLSLRIPKFESDPRFQKAFAMPSLAHHFHTMAANNAWANHRLLAACAQLSQQDFIAPRTSFFPSLKATLNHIVTVDWFYVDALERALAGQPANPDARRFFAPPEPFATCAEIAVAQHAVDQRLLAACRNLADAQLDVPVPILRRTGVEHEGVTRLLAHLFQHQIHHRGQAHAMLAGTSVKPPPLDEFFCANEAPLRAAELAELGLSEDAIWK